MELVRITDTDFYNKLGCSQDDKGVYIYHFVGENLEPKQIGRLLKVDTSGILYIGHTPSRTLFERIADFRKCVLPEYNGTGHSAGRRYNSIDILREKIPPENIAVSVYVTNSKKLEKELLNKYAQEFGEVPPLNSY